MNMLQMQELKKLREELKALKLRVADLENKPRRGRKKEQAHAVRQ